MVNKIILENGKRLHFIFKKPFKIKGDNNEIKIVNVNKKSLKKLFKNVEINIKGDNNKIILPANTNYENVKLSIYNDGVDVKLPVSNEFRNVNISMERGEQQKLLIGDNTTIRGATIKMLESTSLIIGKNCMFARDIEIQTSDFHSIFDKETNKLLNSSDGNSVIIGDNCWVANFAVFLKNSSIANNTIVGNSAVVTKKFMEENVALGGNPAKIIKNSVYWSRERPSKNNIV